MCTLPEAEQFAAMDDTGGIANNGPLINSSVGERAYAIVQAMGVCADEKQAAAACGNVHPIFSGILSGIEQTPIQIRRAQYVSRLRRMDWAFEHAPAEQWRAGRAELIALRELQIDVDPEAQLWNCNAPFEYLITRRVKVVCDLPAGGREVKWMCTGMHDCDISQHFMERHGFGTKVEIIDQPAALPFEVRGVVA